MSRFLTAVLSFTLVFSCAWANSPYEEGRPLPPLLPGHLLPDLLSKENRDRLTSSESLKQRAQYNVEVWETHRFPWLPVTGLVVLGLCLFFVMYVRAHAVRPVETEEERRKRLQQEALQMVQTLAVSSMPPQDFYDKLSHTVRNYLGVIHNLPAATQSTEGFLAALHAMSALPREQQETLAAFLFTADKIEFGDYRPSPSERSEAIAVALSFVQQ